MSAENLGRHQAQTLNSPQPADLPFDQQETEQKGRRQGLLFQDFPPSPSRFASIETLVLIVYAVSTVASLLAKLFAHRLTMASVGRSPVSRTRRTTYLSGLDEAASATPSSVESLRDAGSGKIRGPDGRYVNRDEPTPPLKNNTESRYFRQCKSLIYSLAQHTMSNRSVD